jgi:hypothetical protein
MKFEKWRTENEYGDLKKFTAQSPIADPARQTAGQGI